VIPGEWLNAFPLRPATEAVLALQDAWLALARSPKPGFHPRLMEPVLTKALKAYVENVTAPERGLLGMWAAEGVLHDIDLSTAELTQERRTDIVYGWNDDAAGQRLELVFEFKKMSRLKRDRDHYLKEKGLGRFVTGNYARRQAVAAMVGILVDAHHEVVPPLQMALSDEAVAKPLNLRLNASGHPYDQPSQLFATADFDTEHDRDPSLAASHGSIRVAHFFWPFGYPTPPRTPN
jgi:hypothetical protein